MRFSLTQNTRSLLAAVAALFVAVNVGCGAPPADDTAQNADPIQGGTLAPKDSAVVAILINASDGLYICSGSLIAPNLVLTAHHCIATNTNANTCGGNSFSAIYPASEVVITSSEDAAAAIFNSATSVFPSPDGVTWFGVSSITVPGQNICGQDMAALQLSTAMTGICPLIPRVDVDVSDNEPYRAVGFGATSPDGSTAGTRYNVTGLSVACAEDCNDPTQSATQEWLGVGAVNTGTCEGDSGGPALDANGLVIGSVSRGPADTCDQTVYESMYGEATWVKQVATQAATAGGYAPAGWVTGAATSNAANGYCSTMKTDSGTQSDARVDATDSSSDSASDGDADGGAPGAHSSKGCGCRTVNGTPDAHPLWLLLGAFVLAARRRLIRSPCPARAEPKRTAR
jgi:MYXO-CTERM domain-containing protein